MIGSSCFLGVAQLLEGPAFPIRRLRLKMEQQQRHTARGPYSSNACIVSQNRFVVGHGVPQVVY